MMMMMMLSSTSVNNNTPCWTTKTRIRRIGREQSHPLTLTNNASTTNNNNDNDKDKNTNKNKNQIRRIKRCVGSVGLFSGAILLAALTPTTFPVKSALALSTVQQQQQQQHKYKRNRPSSGEIISYEMQKLAGLSFVWKIISLVLVMTPIVVVGGAMYKGTTGLSWPESIEQSFYLLNDVPGADSTDESTLASKIVANTIVFIGMFTFAVLIGIIGDEIQSRVEEVRMGNSRVIERDHTVILGWNSNLMNSLLEQMAVGEKDGVSIPSPVAILANRDKAEMDEEIANFTTRHKFRIVTRSGVPSSSEDLARVSVWDAKTVVILATNNEDDNDDDEFIKSSGKATSILQLKAGNNTQNIIVQTEPDDAKEKSLLSYAESATDGFSNSRVVTVSSTQKIDRIKSFALIQPGFANLFSDLIVQNDSSEFYCLPCPPEYKDQKFSSVWRAFRKHTLVGFKKDGKIYLAPNDEDLVTGDELLFICEDVLAEHTNDNNKTKRKELHAPVIGSQFEIMRRLIEKEKESSDSSSYFSPRNVAVIGWNGEAPGVLDTFCSIAPKHSSIAMYSASTDEILKTIKKMSRMSRKERREIAVKHVEIAPTIDEDVIKTILASDVQSLLLLPPSTLSRKQQDAYLLTMLLKIKYHANEIGKNRLHVVCSMNSEQTQALAETIYGSRNLEIVLNDTLIASALFQVLNDSSIAALLQSLVEEEGKEIYFRKREQFVEENEIELTWGTLCERARERKELAIGIVRGFNGEIEMNPDKNASVVLEKGDQVVVFADAL